MSVIYTCRVERVWGQNGTMKNITNEHLYSFSNAVSQIITNLEA